MGRLNGSARICPVTNKQYATYFRDGHYFSSKSQYNKCKEDLIEKQEEKHQAFMQELEDRKKAYAESIKIQTQTQPTIQIDPTAV